MADLLSFIPIVVETIDSIRARLDADVNAGLAPTDPSFMDTTPGGFYWDLTQSPALEIERLWDFLATEVVAAMFVSYAWGSYLDEHGVVVNVPRKDAVVATGQVTFSGDNGTLIPTGTQVAVPALDPADDPITFATTATGTISGGVVTLDAAAAVPGSEGDVAAGAVSLLQSPTPGVTTVTNAAAFTGGADVEADDAYRLRLLLAYSAVHGSGTKADYQSWALAYPSVGFVTVEPATGPDGSPLPTGVRLTITDANHNPVSDAVVNGLQDQLDPPEFKTTTTSPVTLPVATIPVVSTSGFATSGQVRWGTQTITYTGKSGTTFTGCTGGTGTVPSGARIAQGFDQANGLAPVGHLVTVATVTTQLVNVSATVTPLAGYSLAGSGGTIAIGQAVQDAIRSYVNTLNPGDDVVLERVSAMFFRVQGVYDVSGVLLNGAASNVAVLATSVAQIGTITLV